MFKPPENEACEREVAIRIVDQIDVQKLRDVADINPAIDQKRAVLATLDRRLIFVVVVGKVNCDGF